jgi:hypothetical protein
MSLSWLTTPAKVGVAQLVPATAVVEPIHTISKPDPKGEKARAASSGVSALLPKAARRHRRLCLPVDSAATSG